MSSTTRRRFLVSVPAALAAGVALPKILKGGIGVSQEAETHPLLMSQLIEAPRVAHSQWAQQDSIQYSEDYYVGADAQHQREYSYGGEGGRLAQQAKGIANVQ